MENTESQFRAIEVALATKIRGILAESLVQKYNLQLYTYNLHNPVIAFVLLNSSEFHFCKMRLNNDKEGIEPLLRGVLDHWISLGVEYNAAPEDRESFPSEGTIIRLIHYVEAEEFQSLAEHFAPQTEFIIFKKQTNSETIWDFMHPLWSLANVVSHDEVRIADEAYFLLRCKKRDLC